MFFTAVRCNRFLQAISKPFLKVYPDIAGYRRIGLLYDDLIAEENDVVKEALRRLPIDVADARTLRLRRAFQLSLSHSELPKPEWTKAIEDKPYLLPIIEEVEKEFAEKDEFDSLKAQ